MLQNLEFKVYFGAQRMKNKVKEFFIKEDGAVNVVEIVIIIAVVIILVGTFKSKITELVGDILDKIVTDGKSAAEVGGKK